MKFVVEPVVEEIQSRWPPKPPPNHTMCVLCSEDPRWCW